MVVPEAAPPIFIVDEDASSGAISQEDIDEARGTSMVSEAVVMRYAERLRKGLSYSKICIT